MGFGGECGNSRAARADGAGVWVWNRRAEQRARMERDLVAHTTALGTADAAKWVWVKRRENCSTQPRATISMSRTAGPCGRSVTESCRAASGGPCPIGNAKYCWGRIILDFFTLVAKEWTTPLRRS